MNDVILPLYHIYHCVFVPMEHYCQLRQMSTRYQAMSQTLPCLYVSEMWYRFDGYLQILSGIIIVFPMCHFIFVNPNPFIMPNRLTGALYLASRSFARLRPAFMLISFVLRTFPISWWLFIKLHLLQLLYSPARRSADNVLCGLRSTIIFTFSIIPYLILFVKHYFSYTNNQ